MKRIFQYLLRPTVILHLHIIGQIRVIVHPLKFTLMEYVKNNEIDKSKTDYLTSDKWKFVPKVSLNKMIFLLKQL